MDLFIVSPPGRVVNTEINFHGLREGVSAYADTRATRRGGVRSAVGAEDFDDGVTAPCTYPCTRRHDAGRGRAATAHAGRLR